MWGRKKSVESPKVEEAPQRLRDALRQARIETAEKTGVVVDLRDAELARLEILNDALDDVFSEIPEGVDLFDRGISRGDIPRLWIDVVAHVEMGRDKRLYRFVQDSRYGRTVLAESAETHETVDAVTKYVARRIIEWERALADDERPMLQDPARDRRYRRRARWRAIGAFLLGAVFGVAAVIGALYLLVQKLG
jgi:hypothetical protein